LIALKRDAPSTSKIYRYKVVEIEKKRESGLQGQGDGDGDKTSVA